MQNYQKISYCVIVSLSCICTHVTSRYISVCLHMPYKCVCFWTLDISHTHVHKRPQTVRRIIKTKPEENRHDRERRTLWRPPNGGTEPACAKDPLCRPSSQISARRDRSQGLPVLTEHTQMLSPNGRHGPVWRALMNYANVKHIAGRCEAPDSGR